MKNIISVFLCQHFFISKYKTDNYKQKVVSLR